MTNANNGYSITALKTFRGMEGSGFNAKLLRNGKHVADLIDGGDGGPFIIEWLDERAGYVDGKFFNAFKDEINTRRMTAEEAALNAWWADAPRVLYFMTSDNRPHYKDAEAFLNGLVDEVETVKHVTAKLKRDFKTGVSYIKNGGVYHTKPKNVASIPSWIEQIKAREGHVVLNTMKLEDAVKLALPLMVQA